MRICHAAPRVSVADLHSRKAGGASDVNRTFSRRLCRVPCTVRACKTNTGEGGLAVVSAMVQCRRLPKTWAATTDRYLVATDRGRTDHGAVTMTVTTTLSQLVGSRLALTTLPW